MLGVEFLALCELDVVRDSLKPIIRKYLAVVLGLLAVIIFFFDFVKPSDSQINLRTGDLRTRWYKVPLIYSRLESPYRTWVNELPPNPDTWITVATYPLPTSNNSDLMCQSFYKSASTWITVDQKIAELVLKDVIVYIQTTNARHGLPDSFQMLMKSRRPDDINPNIIPSIDPSWKNDPQVQEYLKVHNITPPQQSDSVNANPPAANSHP